MTTPKTKTRGRKSLLDAKLQREICDLLERGHTIGTVCGACGFSERSFFDWCEKDAAFFAATQRARAAGRVRILDSILEDEDWRARAWYLERCWPGEFARSEPRTVVVERPPVAVSPSEPPIPRTTTYWTTTGNEIPFTKEQLAYMAEMRRRYAPTPPDKNRNGKK